MKGKLIVIEGVDGSGKATQTELLAQRLGKEGIKVKVFNFPRYGEKSAVLIEDYLNGKLGTPEEVGPYRASLFFAFDRAAAASEIKRYLEEGYVVLCNRYTASNICHQAERFKQREQREKFTQWVENIEYSILGIPKPDTVILLMLPPEIGQKLVDAKGSREYLGGTKRDIHEADLDHLRNAAQIYREFAEKYDWIVINCTENNELRGKEDIAHEIYAKLSHIVQR